jgi:PAS domain S-box-containing protein
MSTRYRSIVAALLPLPALALQGLLWPWLTPFVWVMFYPAVFLAARLDGRRGACLAMVLSTMLIWGFFSTAWRGVAIAESSLIFSTVVFALMSLLFGETQEQILRTRRRDQVAMVDASANLAAIVESSDDAIVGKTLAGIITSWNRGAEKLFGYSAAEAIGQPMLMLFPPGHEAEEAAILTRIASGESVDHFESQRVCKDGRTIEVFATISPIRDSSGRVVGASKIARDITERKRLAAELDRHRHHLQELVDERTRELRGAMQARVEAEAFALAIADNLPGRVTYWDTELRCGFANKGFCEKIGRSRQELLGLPLAAIHGQSVLDQVRHRLDAAYRGDEQHFERVETMADGSVQTSWVHYAPDKIDGLVRGLLVLSTDISELKAHEQRLMEVNAELALARDSAEAANRAKSAFVAHMSHEIRTPMNAIIGLTQLVRRASTDQRQREQLGKVSDAAEHLLSILNDVLDWSKIEAGKMRVENVDFSLDALLGRTLALVTERAQAKGLELVLDTGQLPDRLIGDPTRLSQALLNLLGNAIKFTDRGSVVLQGELLDHDEHELLVRFSVRDTGIGVPPDLLAGLFSAFEQGDGSTTRRYGGTGLGLVITRHLAQLMGGESGAHSELGRGSNFWFSARLRYGQGAQPRRADLGLTGLRALLADDLDPAREALAEMMRTLGLRVDAVASGEAALAALEVQQHDPYRLIVLDWRMPGLDGISTAQRIRAERLAPHAPVLLVSAYGDAELDGQAGEAGILAVLAKPVTASTLHDAVVELLHVPAPAPLVVPAPQPLRQPAELALRQRHGGARVLVAEDNLINQEVAVALLEQAGLRVDVAGNGAEALDMIAHASYRMVLMDMQMPVLDGLQAARAIRASEGAAKGRSGAGLPIIAMTANAFGEDRAACLAAGMNDHVAKPVDTELLYTTLLRWLDRDQDGQNGQTPELAVVARPDGAFDPVGRGDGATAPPGSIGPSPAPLGVSMPVPGSPVSLAAVPDASLPGLLEQRLAEVSGLSPAKGLRLVGGRMGTYLRIALQFADLYRAGVPGLMAALRARDVALARDAVHSFKGASGTLGAEALADLAAQLELAILAGQPRDVLVAIADELGRELAVLVAALDLALGTGQPAGSGQQLT